MYNNIGETSYGGGGGLVAPAVFKTVRAVVIPSRVGSIPTRSRHREIKASRSNDREAFIVL